MHYSLLLGLLFVTPVFADNPLAQAPCTILYSLKGEMAEQFENQRHNLQNHLSRKRIKLLNLNEWQDTRLSGRERNLLRKKYALTRSGNHAVIFNRKGDIVMDITRNIDLVDIIMHCPK